MRVLKIGVLAMLAVSLGGCSKRPWDSAAGIFGAGHSARYVGVGIYSPGTMWTKLVQALAAKGAALAPAAAKLVDDQAVIVVVDSQTGDIRSCGDLTGYCIGMNPWKTPLPAAQATPVSLTTHDDELPTPSIQVEVSRPKTPRHSRKPETAAPQ